MNKATRVIMAALIVFGTLLASAFVMNNLAPSPVTAAKAHSIEQGWAESDLSLLGFETSAKISGTTGTVRFKGTKEQQEKVVRVDLRKGLFATTWRIVGYKETGTEEELAEDSPTAQKAIPPHLVSLGGGGDTYDFAASRTEKSVPGIDYAWITYGTWGDGDIAFVVWTDLGNPTNSGIQSGVSGGDPSVTPYEPTRQGSWAADFTVEGDRVFAYKCSADSAAKNAAIMTIGSQSFPIADGALFLVSTRSGEPVIRQLKRDLSALSPQPGRDHFATMAETETDLRNFFDRSRGDE